MTKYKFNDVVHVRLDDASAAVLNVKNAALICTQHIIAHIPAPKPVVRGVNVYKNATLGSPLMNVSREDADKNSIGLSRTCVLRLEWPDGDTSKKPVVSVESV